MIVDGIYHNGRQCARLARLLRYAERGARLDGMTLDEADRELIRVVTSRARLERDRAAAAIEQNPGTDGIPHESSDGMIDGMNSKQVSQLLGTTDRNVRARAARGTLPAHLFPDGYRFDPIEIAELVKARKGTE